MKRETAIKLLGLPAEFTNSDVLTAYYNAVRAAHPDSAAVPSGVTLAELQTARRVLWREDTLTVNHDTDNACKLCRGTGMVRGRIGASRCVACDGTGEII